jgi:hypothetical protein
MEEVRGSSPLSSTHVICRDSRRVTLGDSSIGTATVGDQLRSIVTWKLSSWCSISSIVVSNRPMRTMPFQ